MGGKRKLTRSELVIGVSGLALYALSLVPRWGSISTPAAEITGVGTLPSASASFNAYYGYGWPLELAIAGGLGVVALVLSRKLLGLVAWRFVYLTLGVVITGLMMVALARGPSETGLENVPGVEVGRGPLAPLALLPAALISASGLGYARRRPRRRRR